MARQSARAGSVSAWEAMPSSARGRLPGHMQTFPDATCMDDHETAGWGSLLPMCSGPEKTWFTDAFRRSGSYEKRAQPCAFAIYGWAEWMRRGGRRELLPRFFHLVQALVLALALVFAGAHLHVHLFAAFLRCRPVTLHGHFDCCLDNSRHLLRSTAGQGELG